MDWLIQEKMLTYFYNTFRPVNHMHYIKCDVNITNNFGCCRRSMTPWITVLSQHTVFKMGVFYKFTLVWYSTKQGTLNRPTSHLVHLYTVPILWLREAHRQQHIWVDDFAGQCLLWRLSSRKTFFAPTLGLTTSLVLGRSWLFSASSINFLTRRSLKSVWVYLTPHLDNGIELLSTVRSRSWKNNFMVHLLLDWQKGWIFMFVPWGTPQVGNQPLVAACGSTSAEACSCCCCCSSSSSSS